MMDHKTTIASEIIKKFTKRFVIIGMAGINLHGINCSTNDIDIWLDPTISVEEWDLELNTVAKEVEKVWKRGEPSEFGGNWPSTRLFTNPILDVARDISGILASEFDWIYERSLISKLGPVAPIEVIIFSKYKANRQKDLMKIIEIGSDIMSIKKPYQPESH